MVWTVTQLAEETGLTKRYINHLILNNQIQAERLTSGWIVSDEEAERFVAERKAKEQEKKSAQS